MQPLRYAKLHFRFQMAYCYQVMPTLHPQGCSLLVAQTLEGEDSTIIIIQPGVWVIANRGVTVLE